MTPFFVDEKTSGAHISAFRTHERLGNNAQEARCASIFLTAFRNVPFMQLDSGCR
jgi:hypothetical protein